VTPEHDDARAKVAGIRERSVIERVWNGDQTDFWLNAAAEPQLLRVRIAICRAGLGRNLWPRRRLHHRR